MSGHADPAPLRSPAAPDRQGGEPRRPKSLTIGAVSKSLEPEFPDISISKIRYLEDQKLLTPRRTAGGYRLYSADDVARLRTILRLQRDEFLPLRVIRSELAAGRTESDIADPAEPGERRPHQAARATRVGAEDTGASYGLQEVLEETGASPELVRELQEFGVVGAAGGRGSEHRFDATEREIVRAAAELARYGVAGRHLRVFRTSADRESALLQQILAPALRSRNPERRREGIEALESLAATASQLKHLLLVRDLRRVARS